MDTLKLYLESVVWTCVSGLGAIFVISAISLVYDSIYPTSSLNGLLGIVLLTLGSAAWIVTSPLLALPVFIMRTIIKNRRLNKGRS